MTGSKKYKKSYKRKSYKGGQARWPAPFNPAPPHSLPSIENRFPNFRPLVLSQFGGKKNKKNKKQTARAKLIHYKNKKYNKSTTRKTKTFSLKYKKGSKK